MDSHLVTNAQLRKTEFVSFIAPQQIVSCGSVVQNSNAITYTTFQQPVACFQTSGQAVSNHAPVPSSSPSPFQTPAPSPTTPSPIFCTSKSPMPPPSQSPSSMSSHRSPAQVPIHSVHCASPSGYPATQSPSATQNIYQVRSPASSPLPSSFATVQLNKVQTTTSMAPATINILQHQQPPTTLPSSTSVTPASAVLSSTALQQLPNGQIMQIIQATPPNSTVRHQPSTMKHIQPKPQQILPKPAGGASQATFGKSMAMAQRTAVNLSPSQGNSLVLGQGQTVLPSSNVTVGPQGTLLLNHISLGVGQNPILIPGGAGLPPSVQLLVRPQPPCATTTSQPAGSMTQTPNMNNAAPFLAALHVQNQPTQQAFLGQPKTLTGQGQTMVIPGQSLGAAQQPQLSNAGLRPNIISSARMVGQTQAPLVLQQIQGPITVIQALQGHNVGVGNAGITLANHGTSAGISQLSGMIPGQAFQSAVAPSLPQSIVLNSQHITTTAPAVQTLINSLNDQTASGQLAQASQLQVQQASSLIAQPASQLPPPGVQQQTGIIAQQQQQPPKPQSVNLEELLKQAGIVPEDSPPTPPPSTTSQVTVSVEPQPISAYNQMTAVVTPQCLPTVNGPQTVVVSQEHIPGQNAQSQLVAHLHQPIMSSQVS